MYDSGSVLGASSTIILPATLGFITGLQFFYVVAAIAAIIVLMNVIAKTYKRIILR